MSAGFEQMPQIEPVVDGCDYDLPMSAEEVEAVNWLLTTLRRLHENGGPNSEKGRLAHNMVIRLTEHSLALHQRVHQLEDILAGRFSVGEAN